MAGFGAAIRGISKILLNKGKKTSSTISSVKPGKKLKQKIKLWSLYRQKVNYMLEIKSLLKILIKRYLKF